MMKAFVENFLQRISGGRSQVGPVSEEVTCPRLVSKDGHVNIVLDNLSTQYHLTMMADMWTTILELGWRCKCATFFVVYLGSWLLFGLIWYAVASIHKDLSTSNSTLQEHKPCVDNVKSIMGAFLYSVETQVVEFVVDSSSEVPFVAAPITAMHVIDGRSPLRALTSSRLHASHFELVVMLDSISETSSDTCQARTSYLPDEIIWGGHFCPLPIVAFPTVAIFPPVDAVPPDDVPGRHEEL
uniref:Potassium channel inwardly rectifying transmembrane domain-containing protein n=1 Tax=Eptatretus burgeri TaxID=7764 RepID=A0A8C4N1Y7_EPTBU